MRGSFWTSDLSIKIEILHALLAVPMPSILLVIMNIPLQLIWYSSRSEEVGQALVWLKCACVGSNFKQPLLGSVKARSVLSSSVDRAELAISCQLFRFT